MQKSTICFKRIICMQEFLFNMKEDFRPFCESMFLLQNFYLSKEGFCVIKELSKKFCVTSFYMVIWKNIFEKKIIVS